MRKAALPVAWSTNTPGADHGTEVHINLGADAAEFGERPGVCAPLGRWVSCGSCSATRTSDLAALRWMAS
ncbi:hypothetical protein BHF99_11575 [Corynebacterium diphtheriae]|nr:hypothetical protein BHF99_11575 [Corynebacterium diphtheriae]